MDHILLTCCAMYNERRRAEGKFDPWMEYEDPSAPGASFVTPTDGDDSTVFTSDEIEEDINEVPAVFTRFQNGNNSLNITRSDERITMSDMGPGEETKQAILIFLID